MENSKSNAPINNNSINYQEVEDLKIKSQFQGALIKELITNSKKIIFNYEKVINQLQELSLLNPERNKLNDHFKRLYYLEIISRRKKIEQIRRQYKNFNKKYKIRTDL